MSDNYDGPQMAQKIMRQQAEIERLRDWQREALPELRYMIDTVCGSVSWKDRMRTLIERARHE